MSFTRATKKQIQAIKNLCFNRTNIDRVSNTLRSLQKQTLYELSVEEAKKLIQELLRGHHHVF